MNIPPKEGTRVSHERLRDFVQRAAAHVGLDVARSRLLADLLTQNDLYGNVSHGTQQIATYARLMRDGVLNPAPKVSVVKETAVSLLVDGDGGLGYFPAHDGTNLLVKKALDSGIAVLCTRNHGHFGAAGIYARIPLASDLLTFVTSGHQLKLSASQPLFSAAGGSPMAFSAPADEGPDLLVDFGCMHDLYASDPHRDEVAALTPGLVLRSIGMGEICQTWGGILSGLALDPDPPRWTWKGANQGALVICFRIDLFRDPRGLKGEVDAYGRRIADLTPIPPFDRSYIAGGAEADRDRDFRRNGIPLGQKHLDALRTLAEELGIEPV